MLASTVHLKRHRQIHKDQKFREMSYIDPENARYPSWTRPNMFISDLLFLLRGKRID